jgi:hypothetical protein
MSEAGEAPADWSTTSGAIQYGDPTTAIWASGLVVVLLLPATRVATPKSATACPDKHW